MKASSQRRRGKYEILEQKAREDALKRETAQKLQQYEAMEREVA